jgi:GT2 family glycosyltransferase
MSAELTLGVVVIGRNEGKRLRVCLSSLLRRVAPHNVVYVDSGSTDGSALLAQSMGCDVVNLNMQIPFTAARARNEGLVRALEYMPALEYLQFVDGDCEVREGWLNVAAAFLEVNPGVAAVCGRRRERAPHASVYNALCDMEWNTPVGQAKSCGGDVLMRVPAIQAVGGYRSDLIAGEEPELCVRLRAAGWKIWRLDSEMTWHDAAIHRFSQWWNRNKRAGYAYAEGAFLHGGKPERHCVRNAARALTWGVLLPVLAFVGAAWRHEMLLIGLLYPLQILRLVKSSSLSGVLAWQRAYFLTLGKFAEVQGIFRFVMNRLQNKAGRLIEYK